MINLTKNSRISLEKNGSQLKEISIGLDWGSIQHSYFFGLLKDSTAVDLDGSVSLFAGDKQEIETVYFHNLKSRDGAIKHSGDDRVGDSSADNKDNEIIYINLEQINPKVTSIFIYLNSYKQQDFASIPYAKIKIVEGKNHNPQQTFATYNIASDETYIGYVSMIMGKIEKLNNNWTFTALGDPIKAKNIKETVMLIQDRYM